MLFPKTSWYLCTMVSAFQPKCCWILQAVPKDAKLYMFKFITVCNSSQVSFKPKKYMVPLCMGLFSLDLQNCPRDCASSYCFTHCQPFDMQQYVVAKCNMAPDQCFRCCCAWLLLGPQHNQHGHLWLPEWTHSCGPSHLVRCHCHVLASRS